MSVERHVLVVDHDAENIDLLTEGLTVFCGCDHVTFTSIVEDAEDILTTDGSRYGVIMLGYMGLRFRNTQEGQHRNMHGLAARTVLDKIRALNLGAVIIYIGSLPLDRVKGELGEPLPNLFFDAHRPFGFDQLAEYFNQVTWPRNTEPPSVIS